MPRFPILRPRAGGAVTALFLAGLAVTGAAAVLVAPTGLEPANAQSAASSIDQPTAATLPPGTSTVKDGIGRDRPNGQVSAPSALKPSTKVVPSGTERDAVTDPAQHLPGNMRRGG